MRAAPLIPVFLDASMLLAAAGSPQGGASVVLYLCGEFVAGAVSAAVLTEAERNIHAKLPPAAWERWQYLLLTTPLVSVEVPADAERYADAVSAKDAHVYAAALAARSRYLITLDRPLITRVKALAGPLLALTPGTFLTTELRGGANR